MVHGGRWLRAVTGTALPPAQRATSGPLTANVIPPMFPRQQPPVPDQRGSTEGIGVPSRASARRTLSCSLALTLLALSPAVAAQPAAAAVQATYYVSPSGNDSNAGTS